ATVRDAASQFGNRTQNLFDELRRPTAQPQQPLPQASSAAQAPPPSTAQLFPPQSAPSQTAGGAWNSSAPSDPPAARPPPLNSSSGQPAAPPTRDWNAPSPVTPLAPSPGAPPADSDPWRNVADDRLRSTPPAHQPAADIPNLASRPSPFGGNNVDWNTPPAQGPLPGPAPAPAAAPIAGPLQPGSSSPPATSPAAPAAGPQIQKQMLAQPGDRPLDDAVQVASQPSASDPWRQPAASGLAAQGASASAPPAAAPLASAPPASQGNLPPGVPASPRRDNAALVLAAWVLLSGSVAGNFYLFWSYLDVRQKYRSLVRKTARAVGRFSAA
ncbi:MAG: hypothetical protein IT424_01260, partial [Pirellulales bacterium]|nr:hypothetical protein [Pirellulales bacterium]